MDWHAAGHPVPGLGQEPSVRSDARLQGLWRSIQGRPWSSLAILPASPSVDALEIAELLAKLVGWYEGQPSCVLDLRDLSQRLLEYHLHEVRAQVDSGSRVFIALRPTAENPTTVPMARAADATVLCVELGKSSRQAAKATLEAVGRERFLGSIALGEGTAKPSDQGR
jgi:hypothetical protein